MSTATSRIAPRAQRTSFAWPAPIEKCMPRSTPRRGAGVIVLDPGLVDAELVHASARKVSRKNPRESRCTTGSMTCMPVRRVVNTRIDGTLQPPAGTSRGARTLDRDRLLPLSRPAGRLPGQPRPSAGRRSTWRSSSSTTPRATTPWRPPPRAPGCIVDALPENLGFGRANNRGFDRATGRRGTRAQPRHGASAGRACAPASTSCGRARTSACSRRAWSTATAASTGAASAASPPRGRRSATSPASTGTSRGPRSTHYTAGWLDETRPATSTA